MRRWKTRWAAVAVAGAVLVAGAATGGIDGPAIWNLTDDKNPDITSQVNIVGASGPYFINIIADCAGGAVRIIGLNNQVTRLRNRTKDFRIDNNVKGLPAFMRIQADAVGYDGRFEPTRADRCALDVVVNDDKGRGRAKLDCRPGSDAFGMTPFPTEEQIDFITSTCKSDKRIAISGKLKRVKVFLKGPAELAPPP